MAPTETIDNKRPGTLPADFGEWDSKETPATLPDNFDGFDASLATRGTKTVVAQQLQGQTGNWIPGSRSNRDKSPVAVSMLKLVNTAVSAADPKEVDLELPQTLSKISLKMRMRAMTVGSILLLATIALFMFLRPRQNSSSQKHVVVVQRQNIEALMKPSPGTAAEPIVPREIVPTTVSDLQTESLASRVQPETMNNQLAAPTRISRDIKRGDEQQAPTLSVAGMENISGNSGDALKRVFSGRGSPQVRTENRVIQISAGVAVGLILRKVTPIYPTIAKNARVEGTVILTATISKAGMIEDLRVASGPPMLRQAAIDAVKSWQYKPYFLDNQPVDVATTVSVIFALSKS